MHKNRYRHSRFMSLKLYKLLLNVEYVFGNKFCFYSFFSVFGKVANIAGRNRDCSFILEAVEHVTARSAYAFLSGI